MRFSSDVYMIFHCSGSHIIAVCFIAACCVGEMVCYVVCLCHVRHSMFINVFDRMRIKVCVRGRCVCVFWVMSDCPVTSSRRRGESSEHTWMRSSL